MKFPYLTRHIINLPGSVWPYVLLFFLLLSQSTDSLAANCVYISSYHLGYEWNDGIERGLESVIKDKCKISKFYMDTKRNQDESYGRKQGLAAKEFILAAKPDVVIAADDNASRFLVKPHFRNSSIPFVFCGINWTVDEYGYPYTNATGMIEVAPIAQTLKAIQNIQKSALHGTYLSSKVFTEYKDFERYRALFAGQGIELSGVFVSSMKDWVKSYTKAQKSDFIILGNNAGINDWQHSTAIGHVKSQSKILTVTNYDWMMPYSMFAITKQPEEQGEWAGQVALAILNKQAISNIPIVVNRRTNMYVNPALIKNAGVQLPADLVHRAIKVDQ